MTVFYSHFVRNKIVIECVKVLFMVLNYIYYTLNIEFKSKTQPESSGLTGL